MIRIVLVVFGLLAAYVHFKTYPPVCPTEDSVWCVWQNDAGELYLNGGHD